MCRSRNTDILVLSLTKHGQKVAQRNQWPKGQGLISGDEKWLQSHLTWKKHSHKKRHPVQNALWKNFSTANSTRLDFIKREFIFDLIKAYRIMCQRDRTDVRVRCPNVRTSRPAKNTKLCQGPGTTLNI